MRKLIILITGAAGFIGSVLCRQLASGNKVIGVDITGRPVDVELNIIWQQADLTDFNSVTAICEKYSPDVVIHCAGIAHQKVGAVSAATYMRVNSEATENLAKAALKVNPGVLFIFFSSVSVYGEDIGDQTVSEEHDCFPSSDYAASKLDAERRLCALYDEGKLHNLVILRLAPVYDREWSLNLDRRVFAPGKLAYLRFGSGMQKMSALARPNLVGFIEFLSRRWPQMAADEKRCLAQRRKDAKRGRISTDKRGLDSGFRRNDEQEGRNDKKKNLRIFNVCDAEPYEFSRIIKVFKKSGIRPGRPVILVPLSVVWLATRIAGILFPNKKNWLHSCYDKLASDLIFDNEKMLGTGFRPIHTLETIFHPQMISRKGAKTLR